MFIVSVDVHSQNDDGCQRWQVKKMDGTNVANECQSIGVHLYFGVNLVPFQHTFQLQNNIQSYKENVLWACLFHKSSDFLQDHNDSLTSLKQVCVYCVNVPKGS